MSPTHGHDELAHVESQLEFVTNTRTIDKAAIGKLCIHTKADIQEHEVLPPLLFLINFVFTQELISLLHFLDKDKVGHVSVHDFACGLQSCKNSAQVASASTSFKSPELLPLQRRHTISTVVSF